MRLAPGIGATLYGNLPRYLSADVISVCDHVTLHTRADASDVQSAAKVRAMGCSRVWLAIPANYLVRMSDSAAVAEVKRCAAIARDMGAEVFELNGEGSSDGRTPGDWIAPANDPNEAERLENLAVALFTAAREVLKDDCALGWTSHDGTGFRVPRRFLSLVDLHSPQHYPAMPGRTASQTDLARRIAWSQGQWDGLAARGRVPDEVTPYAFRWSPYYQGHGHAVGALVWGLCEAATARLWAYPSSWSPEGLKALRAARVIRAGVGACPGSDDGAWWPDVIERWQASQGLTADGIVGPRTLAMAGVV
jgi:hypothetical protein